MTSMPPSSAHDTGSGGRSPRGHRRALSVRPDTGDERRARYWEHCSEHPEIPLFSQAWWLDAVAPKTWDAVMVEDSAGVAGSLPFVLRRRFGLVSASQAQLTQTAGPWIRPSAGKPAEALSYEMAVLAQLAESLPPVDRYTQNWHFSQTNWLPFHWAGFSQSTCYTYRLENLSDPEALWLNLRENIRREIRKAKTRFGLEVTHDADVGEFLELNAMVFDRQGRRVPYPASLVHRIDSVAGDRSRKQVLVARDRQGRAHAATYMVWDDASAYYLMGGADPAFRTSGATSLCLWESILHVSPLTRSFDFEGSMIQSLERLFRAFGATQTPYFHVSRTYSRRMRLALALRR